MAGIKITDLPAAPSATLSDVFPVDQGAVTYKEDNQQVLTLFKANGEALSRTNDTNVTMTLGGAPTTALLNATSMTLGWTGSLAVGRGGTANTTFTAYSVICAGTTATGAFQNVSGVGTSAQVLTSNGAAALPTWQAVPAPTGAALTKVDDTNVTLTLGGTPTTALLQATSITAGWTGTLSGTRGGTGVNNGASTLTLGGSLTTSGAFASTFTMTGITSVTLPTSGTLATTSQIPTGAALTKTDDTNVTLTLGGSPTTALVNATSITAGWTGQLSVARGGSGAGSFTAYSVICGGATATGSLQNVVGLGNAGEQLTSNGAGALPTWQAGTVSPLTTKGDLYTFTTVNARLAVGTINGQILQVSSGAATGLAWSTATYPATASNVARILRSDGTNWIETTSTFADTYAASGFLYANGANNVAGLATANNGLPVTGNTGVPVMLAGPAATGRVLTSNTAAAPSWSTSTFPSVGGTAGNIFISDGTNYIASTSLWPNTVGSAGKILRSDGTTNAYTTATFPTTAGSSGNVLTSDGTNWSSSAPTASGTVNSGTQNQLAYYAATGTAVSGLATAASGVLVTSAGGVPSISSTLPAFTTSSITFSPTTGGIVGTTTNDNAAAGKVGELISSVVAGPGNNINSSTTTDLTSISLTAGDWDLQGNIYFSPSVTITNVVAWMSTTSATPPDVSLRSQLAGGNAFSAVGMNAPFLRLSLASTTTVYLSGFATLSAGTCTFAGGIYARRVR